MSQLSKETILEKKWIRSRTNAVYDPEFSKVLQNIPWSKWFEQDNPLRCREEYLETYSEWIMLSKTNSISGLDVYSVKHLINGTTQVFDESYYKYAHKRLRLFRGEYAYHRRAFRNWKFIEDEDLAQGDYVIISAPFCSTGKIPRNFTETLNECLRKNIPVILDCAYFGTCVDLKIDVNHDAIESVCFSLTKGLGVGDVRSGIRFTRKEDDYPISQQNKYEHTILAAAKIGLHMMQNFSPDFIVDKYRKMQLDVCRMANITPTPCMHLALGSEENWSEFKVDKVYNRLGIRELIRARRKGEI